MLVRTLSDASLATRLVINLKEMDRLDSGYLNAQMIDQAIQETLTSKGLHDRNPSRADLTAMLRPLNRNTQQFHNYREFLIHLFGYERGDKYFLMDKEQLEHEAGAESAREDGF